jgi:hypothetical protein
MSNQLKGFVLQADQGLIQILTKWCKEVLNRQPTADELKAAWKHLTQQELNDKGVKLLMAKLKEGLEDE